MCNKPIIIKLNDSDCEIQFKQSDSFMNRSKYNGLVSDLMHTICVLDWVWLALSDGLNDPNI
jgi:hypothetical protein